ncbi:hypothetical protein BCR34DRAFT_553723 [Clohesyomyces aquaticus]|uniref:Uncharacterized protein n=1 Tax=Clohesyomyces aquaticus TaxID=1231657 RepID=A0A1Y2A7J1_9PLEO|nr:hypothetical protein BCR34DRAFT_553723 [Clohesyomyces aquaticus]
MSVLGRKHSTTTSLEEVSYRAHQSTTTILSTTSFHLYPSLSCPPTQNPNSKCDTRASTSMNPTTKASTSPAPAVCSASFNS